MDNTIKLLMAFIEASGFEVEAVVTRKKVEFSYIKALFTDRYNQQGDEVTVDYKVTKKEPELVIHKFAVDDPVRVNLKKIEFYIRPACSNHEPKGGMASFNGHYGICKWCNGSIRQGHDGKWERNR